MKIHSSVGVITNSSTQIYTSVSNIELIKDFIDQILVDLGDDKKADDLYNFKIVPDYSVIEKVAKVEYPNVYYSERNEKLIEEFTTEEILEKWDRLDHWNYHDPGTHLEITTKDGKHRISNFNDIYLIDAEWDG